MTIRPPAVAGMFYEGTPGRLRAQVEECFAANPPAPAAKERFLGAVVPHAGLMYSGHVAAAFYALADLPKRLIILCPNHTGAGHFAACIKAVRELSPATRIEVLVPDFRGRLDVALDILAGAPPDVMNHNLETVPRLYKHARPGADYANSLALLQRFKMRLPHVPTKSGLMLGLGETDDEIMQVLRDLRAHNVDMLTLGQYLQPSAHHLPVLRYAEPAIFKEFERAATRLGFAHAACGPMVRSSYHADQQAHAAGVAA